LRIGLKNRRTFTLFTSKAREEEQALLEKKQADKLEEERVRKAKETALAATELATTAHPTLLPTEAARSSERLEK